VDLWWDGNRCTGCFLSTYPSAEAASVAQIQGTPCTTAQRS
jgi:hypothetical protein